MITYLDGDIFEQNVEAIVNPVNCKGVMGAGLAKQVKDRYPQAFREYGIACRRGDIGPGDLHVVHFKSGLPEYIFNLATKDHYRDPGVINRTWPGFYAQGHGLTREAGKAAVEQCYLERTSSPAT